MARVVRDLLAAAQTAIRSEDGPGLAATLSLDPAKLPGGHALPVALLALNVSAAVSAVFNEHSTDGSVKRWHRVLTDHLTALAAIARDDIEAAFDAEHAALSEFLLFVSESNTNWLVRPLHVLVASARTLSVAVEKRMAERGARDAAAGKIVRKRWIARDDARGKTQCLLLHLGKNDSLRILRCACVLLPQNALTTTLRNAFSYTVNHRLPRELIAQSKKWGALGVVNVLFAMYFKLNQLRQCKFLINAVEGVGFPPLEQFPVPQVVTYRYFAGRLAMFDDNFARANAALTYAAGHCHRDYPRNRRRILEALVPVRMALGVLPTPRLLDTHGLQHYAGVADALRTGDVGAFAACLEAHREQFIAAGVYLLLERLQLAVYRTLFKRVVALAGSTRLPLSLLQAGLVAAGVPLALDEVECIVVNLVAGKYIRGYLSHRPPFLVVAKERAFRPLAEVAAEGGGQQ